MRYVAMIFALWASTALAAPELPALSSDKTTVALPFSAGDASGEARWATLLPIGEVEDKSGSEKTPQSRFSLGCGEGACNDRPALDAALKAGGYSALQGHEISAKKSSLVVDGLHVKISGKGKRTLFVSVYQGKKKLGDASRKVELGSTIEAWEVFLVQGEESFLYIKISWGNDETSYGAWGWMVVPLSSP